MRGSQFFKSPAKARRVLYLLAGTGVGAAAVQANAGHHPFVGDSPLSSSKEKLRFGWESVVRSSRALYTMTIVVVDYKYSLHRLESDSDEYWRKLSVHMNGYLSLLAQHYKAKRPRSKTGFAIMTSWFWVHLRSAKRILKLCEVNKGFYVKAGQFVSSMRQVPKEYSSILSSLQDQAVPHHFKDIKEVMVTNLGKDLHELFLTFDEQPIAAASIAQVHHALLKSGQEVAVKVQYPRLEQRMKIDLTTMAVLSKSVAWFFPEYKFERVVSEFKRVLSEELDFIHEAKNAERTARNFKNNTTVRVPCIFWDLTTPQVLTMQFCIGHKVDDLEFMKRSGINPLKVAKALMEVFSEMIFIHGFLHGDPHPGNILVSSRGRNGFSLVILDHGYYKELDERFRLDYCQLWKALILRDSKKIQHLGEKFGVGKYARYFPIIFTGRTINSKSALWRELTIEEKKNLNQELRYLNVGDISAFMESLPPDFFSILRTDGILRSLTGKLGAPRRVRILAYAKYAVYGLAKQSHMNTDSTFKSAVSKMGISVSNLPLIALIEILELISQFEDLRHSLVNKLKRMLSGVYYLLSIGVLKL